MPLFPANTPPPREVRRACYLLLGSFIVGLLVAPGLQHGGPGTIDASLAIALSVVTAAMIWLLVKIRARKNWARWVTLLLAIWGLASTADSLQAQLSVRPFLTMIDIMTSGLELIALTMLFTTRSNDWFAGQTGQPGEGRPPESAEASGTASTLGIDCPHCHNKIAFLSRAMLKARKQLGCPYCGGALEVDVAYIKFIVLGIAIGFPVRLLGSMVPGLSILNHWSTAALLMGLAFAMSARLRTAANT